MNKDTLFKHVVAMGDKSTHGEYKSQAMTDMHREAYLVPIVRPINVIDVWEHTPSDYYRRGEYPRHIRPVGPRCGDFDTAVHYRDEQEKQA